MTLHYRSWQEVRDELLTDPKVRRHYLAIRAREGFWRKLVAVFLRITHRP